ncbi:MULTISPECIES: NAD(P)-dependent oxidoreductase [Nocardiaceae]|uniref:Adenosylhomocysteinase n=1 Tax=Rhodococcoides corynebacterioides TaxID=53972 RepID=A0ABS2KYZ8_9NOCA|nr:MULTISPECIES: NAD(P)-dependent oxidoreductase [Rhodococcus]MBM7416840.1 adenosylhomocysteinase [Rhodococcus corynebacterioides]MBP1115093.1 adenosylhomocysteinase [Rhodococcus sp. PvP016]
MTEAAGRVRGFYNRLNNILPSNPEVSIICVTHTVGNSPQFVRALSAIGNVGVVLAKGNSYHTREREIIENSLKIPVIKGDRTVTANPQRAARLIREYCGERPVIIADVGGYFSGTVDALLAEGVDVIGVLEGTENGLKSYEENVPASVPIVSVARSPLKNAEDHLVGAGVVFSIESVLRSMTQLLQGRRACVVGFGKIGAGVAHALRGRGVPTVVCERNAIRRAEASAYGYEVVGALPEVLARVDMIVSATGAGAITMPIVYGLRSGTILATVTSADSELQFENIDESYSSSEIVDGLDEYRPIGPDGNSFFLVNKGDPANFLHGAVEGPALELINAEKIAAVAMLSKRQLPHLGNIQEIGNTTREKIASLWSEWFTTDLMSGL